MHRDLTDPSPGEAAQDINYVPSPSSDPPAHIQDDMDFWFCGAIIEDDVDGVLTGGINQVVLADDRLNPGLHRHRSS